MLWMLACTAIVVAGLRARQVRGDLVLGIGLGGAGFAVLMAVLDPGARPTAESMQGWLLLLVLLVPVLGYRAVLRWARQRSAALEGASGGREDHPAGFVLIENDAALTAEVQAKLRAAGHAAVPGSTTTGFSIGFRGDDGAIHASGRVTLTQGLADFGPVWVEPEARANGLGRRLMAEMEREAGVRGARRAVLQTFSWQAEGFYAALGYSVLARVEMPEGGARLYMSKDLS
ncbi:GNAT family N-acetyltransferase [Algicella marina]|uniref:GNAT family N-acetyltransferase n=1 Tax=Algicella marina TaxID=2683284 RepID=A0A6P1T366_9RHOB|nr:GNAT family N-acetyltransferase [Algicella marina]QHQ35916.1 GNAT family N-acetyltransferase [Algicella marina]